MNYFMKNLRNEITLASSEKSMRSYVSGTRDIGEAGDVSEETVTAWIERLQELTEG